MKKIVSTLALVTTLFGTFAMFSESANATAGYMRKDGTYVAPYYRRP